MKAYTKRHNVNRGYMKLQVWLKKKKGVDVKLSSQILDATQSTSSNIAEGYSRRTLNEYLQHLNISLGSFGEVLTRAIGFQVIGVFNDQEFEEVDKLHFSIENKLIALIRSLQAKRKTGTWEIEFK
jgi:four helix bundle protein